MFSKALQLLTSSFKTGNDRTQKLKSNIVGSVIIKLFAIAIELLKVPILLAYLSTEKYGVWLTVVSVIMWVQNFDMGLGTGLRYKLTEALANEDNKRAQGLVSTAYFSMAAIMTTVFALLVPFILFSDWNAMLNVTIISNHELQKTVMLIFAVVTAQIIFELISTILKADQRAAISDIFKPVASAISLGLIFALTFVSNDSLFLASLAMALPYLLVLIFVNIYFFSTNYHHYKPGMAHFRKIYLKDIYSLGFKFFVGQISALVVFSSSNILLTTILNPDAVAVYSTAYTYHTLAIIFFTVVNVPLFSAITDAYVRKDFHWIRKSMRTMTKIAAVFSIGVLFMLLMSDFALNLWVGDKIKVPTDLSIVLSSYVILALFVSPYNNFLGGVGKLNVILYISIIKMVVFIPAAIYLVRAMGSVGLVLAIIVVNTLPNFILGIVQYNKIINNKASGIWNK